MPRFDMAIVVTIEADDYEDAQRKAEEIATLAEGVFSMRGENVEASTPLDYDRDNDGQRVLYLHPENEPVT